MTGLNKPHSHHTNEILLCLSDSGIQWIEDTAHQFSKGDLFLLPSGVPHHLEARDNTKADYCFVCFDTPHLSKNGIPPGILHELRRHDIVRFSGKEKNWTPAIMEIHDEISQGLPFMEERSASLLFVLLIDMFRLSLPRNRCLLENRTPLETMIDQIAHSPEETIDIDTAASRVAMSRSHFTVQFRRKTGMSFTRFLRESRVKKAISLLKETNLSITDIGYQAGFDNPSYFYRCFKASTAFSPRGFREYLKKHGNFPGVL